MTMTLPRLVDFSDFHESQVPRWLAAGRGRPGARDVGAGRSLTLVLRDGVSYSYISTGDDLVVRPGAVDTGVMVELDAAAFSDFANEMWSVFGLMYSNRVTVTRGTFDQFAAWEPALQALWFDRPIYRADAADLAGLDLAQSFTLESDRIEMADFLRRAGFLVVRGAFAAEEIAALNEIVARERAEASPADKKSWWATDADGNEVCCRLTYTAERDPRVWALGDDPRLRRLVALTGIAMEPCLDRVDGVGVVIKNPSIVAGLSDLPWHRDCGMGGHFVLCPGLNIGIQLDRADAANGQLWFLAGSHRHATQMLTMDAIADLPVVSVEADPGDVTVHFGHVLHAAPPPSSLTAARKTMYVGWHVPELFDIVGKGQAYNDVLFTHGDGRVKSVGEAS